ncbi:MAG: NADH-quinone oxidoreductase subunit F, partial [Betaproteobacteria bacterium]|nr:NADH-quinone oxidoreductase subunit F [Betaproteobacteria bacterium]
RHLVALAKLMNLPMAEVYEVATFYHHFDIVRGDREAPALTIRVCSGLSCALAQGEELLQRLPALLGRTDLRVIAAPCVGRCEQAPIAVVDQFPVAHATPDRVIAAVQANQSRHPTAADDGHWHAAQLSDPQVAAATRLETSLPNPSDTGSISPPYTGYATYRTQGGYALAVSVAASLQGPDSEIRVNQILQTLDDSALRGLGGAGFQAGRKWRIVREQPGPRLMAVNIDEGEPGTFKDRTYLERDPHRFLEGMLIAAQIVGIESCYIYLRDEYHGCRAILETELARLHADPPCPLPHIELRRGAGAYICGEESAMIESIEGKRGEPRMRPPYIAQVGLFGRPTLEHNFETLYWVRDILERGAAWFSDAGRHGRRGLRSFSVSGRVRHPGVKLAPAGITLHELIGEYCGGMLEGHILYAYLPGGASG